MQQEDTNLTNQLLLIVFVLIVMIFLAVWYYRNEESKNLMSMTQRTIKVSSDYNLPDKV